jgi:hypothetical protein
VAFSLAAMHRVVGPDFAFATANPEHIAAGASVAQIFVPSDLDQIVPYWKSSKTQIPKRSMVEAGSD